MTARRSLLSVLSLAVAAVAFVVTGLVLYHDSYSAATRIGDWRRLPLAYPWHVVDYGRENSGVQLDDWRVYAGEIEAKKPGPVPMDAEPERVDLQTLKYIGRFAFMNGYLYGVRDVHYPPNAKGEVDVPKWFIIKCGQDTPCYYDTEDEYRKQCELLGVAAEDIQPFAEQWESFHKKISEKSILVRVLSGWCYFITAPSITKRTKTGIGTMDSTSRSGGER